MDVLTRAVLEMLPWFRPESIVEIYKSFREALDVNQRNQGTPEFDVVPFVLRRSKSLDPNALGFRQPRDSWNSAFPGRKFRDTN